MLREGERHPEKFTGKRQCYPNSMDWTAEDRKAAWMILATIAATIALLIFGAVI